jgi:hypothetical protein
MLGASAGAGVGVGGFQAFRRGRTRRGP